MVASMALFFLFQLNEWFGECLAILHGHSDEVLSVSFHPNGKLLASGSADCSLVLWDVDARRRLVKLTGHEAEVSCIAFDKEGKLLASGDSRGLINIWDADSRKLLQSIPNPLRTVRALTFGNEKGVLVATSGWQTCMWHIRKKDAILRYDSSKFEEHVVPGVFVGGVALGPTDRLLATGLGGLCVRDMVSGKIASRLTGHANNITNIAFRLDGAMLASASVDGTVRLWEVCTGRERKSLFGNLGIVEGLAFSGSGLLLAAGGTSKEIVVWDAVLGNELIRLTGHESRINCVAFHPTQHVLATASLDKTVRLWKLSRFRLPGSRFVGSP